MAFAMVRVNDVLLATIRHRARSGAHSKNHLNGSVVVPRPGAGDTIERAGVIRYRAA